MPIPSEGAIPRHLLNRVHWDKHPRVNGSTNIVDMGYALCGRHGDLLLTRTRSDVTCKKCVRQLEYMDWLDNKGARRVPLR